MQCMRYRKGAGGDLCVKVDAIFANHLVTATHAAHFGFQYSAAGVTEGLAGGDMGLLADNAFAMNFLYALFAIGDDPVTCLLYTSPSPRD